MSCTRRWLRAVLRRDRQWEELAERHGEYRTATFREIAEFERAYGRDGSFFGGLPGDWLCRWWFPRTTGDWAVRDWAEKHEWRLRSRPSGPKKRKHKRS